MKKPASSEAGLKLGLVFADFMKNLLHFIVMIYFLNLIMCQADKFMAGIVDPEVVILAIEDMLSAPVVWLDRKSWLSIYPLIGTDLVVVDSNLDVFPRNSCLHDSIHK